MATLSLSDKRKARLVDFLKYRKLRDRAIESLQVIKKKHNLQRSDLETAKTLNYSEIVESLIKAVNKKWLAVEELVALLEDSELAGKQHVCVFKASSKLAASVVSTLATPSGNKVTQPSLDDFIDVPTASSVQIIKATATDVTIRIVTRREYWIINQLDKKPTRELYEKLKRKERASLVIKASTTSGLVQVRVPPKQKGQQETASSVYQFIIEALTGHYDMGAKSWFHQLEYFPLTDAFSKILKDTTRFELWYDTPHNKKVQIRLGRMGRPKPGNDLRSDKDWTYESGYARKTLRGFWLCPKAKLFTHMNADSVSLGKGSSRDIARVFVPDLCTDGDIEHVVAAIHGYV